MIGYGMLYTVAVGIPIALAALAISGVLRRHGRPERLVWLGALVTALALPAVALLDPLGGAAPGGAPAPGTGVIGLPAVVVVAAEDSSVGWGALLVAAWLLASTVLVLRWAVALLRLRRASRSWRRSTLDGVPVWLTDELGPAVAGTLRPRVLVPGWLGSLPTSQRSLVLLHEQEHIRAHDPVLIALARAARIAAPWNPVVWLLSSRLVRAVELDCDRRVLRRNADVATYGRTLLTVSERRPGRLVAVAAFAESEAPLRNRILAMTTPSRTISIVALLTSMVLGVVLLVGALEIPVPAVSIQIAVESGGPADAGDAAVRPVERAAPAADRNRADEPPSAAAAVSGLRAEAEASRPTPTTPPTRSGAVVERADPDVSARPIFTPYTVAPTILNRGQVQRAMVEGYPALLRDAGIGGTVRVYFFIDEDGVVGDRRVDTSSGHAGLDEAALSVASVFRFSPALNRDRRTPVWVVFPITFQVR
jgi:TonB family protein